MVAFPARIACMEGEHEDAEIHLIMGREKEVQLSLSRMHRFHVEHTLQTASVAAPLVRDILPLICRSALRVVRNTLHLPHHRGREKRQLTTSENTVFGSGQAARKYLVSSLDFAGHVET